VLLLLWHITYTQIDQCNWCKCTWPKQQASKNGGTRIRGLALGARSWPGWSLLAMPHVRAAKITFDRFDRRYEIKGNERRRRERRRGCRCGCVADLLRMGSDRKMRTLHTGVDRFLFCSLLYPRWKSISALSYLLLIEE